MNDKIPIGKDIEILPLTFEILLCDFVKLQRDFYQKYEEHNNS